MEGEQPGYWGLASDRLAAAQRVADAWNDPGPVPPVHDFVKVEVSRRWPTLAKAVEELAELYERP